MFRTAQGWQVGKESKQAAHPTSNIGQAQHHAHDVLQCLAAGWKSRLASGRQLEQLQLCVQLAQRMLSVFGSPRRE